MLQRRLFCSLIAGAITLTLLFTLTLHNPADALQNLHTNLASRSAQQHAIQAPTGGDHFVVPSTPMPSTTPFTDFPPLIWQTGSDRSITQYHNQTLTWTNLNPDHKHTILYDAAADTFVRRTFAHRPSLIHLWSSLSTPVLRADLLRYLLMLARGGVYSDIDTTCLVPIASWIPPQYRMHAAAVLGIEYDDTTYPMFVRPVSFNQWTLMAKPNHPIFVKAVERVQSNLEFLARQKRTKTGVAELKLEMVETLEATGPGMISDVVLEVLRDQMRREGKKGDISWKTFQGLREPRLFGDVLVLPINGFAGHQKHSHSGQKGWGTKLVQHHFGRSWYDKGKGKDKDKSKENEKGKTHGAPDGKQVGKDEKGVTQADKAAEQEKKSQE